MSNANYWQEKFPDMVPCARPPGMFTLNGIGTMAYGRRDYDAESNTYVKTLCFTFVFLPLFALRAYRVADAERGWYFIGKVPLSGLARGWNFLMLAALVLGGGGFAWWEHHRNPENVAARQLAEGDRLAEAGRPGQAATHYREAALSRTSSAQPALSKLGELLDKHLDDAEAWEVIDALEVAVDVHGAKDQPANIVAKGLEQARRRADSDPKSTLKIVETIEPVAPGERDLLTIKLKVLEKIIAAEPDNLEAVSSLAMVLERQQQWGECEKLLTAHRDKLGALEGARILGQIYARNGKLDEALPLLQAYVDQRLDSLHAAETSLQGLVKQIDDRTMDQLKGNNAPGFNYKRHKSADRHEQDTMVQQYLDESLKSSAEFRKAQDKIRRETAVVPVALDLGIVLLRRGHALADPEARKRELEKAEKTFLAVRTSAGKSDEFRLNLGQVYYWLGKNAEGKKLFDEMLADNARNTKTLLAVGQVAREVGAVSEARPLVEEAFTRETDPRQKALAARVRSSMWRDLDDRVMWLKRIQSTDAIDLAELAAARGEKALQENQDAEAAMLLREALRHYATLPESTTILNNSALVYFSLYSLTGDAEELNRGMLKMEKAVALDPRNSILVSNAADTILVNALWDIAGAALDRKVLRQGGWDMLAFLYADKAQRDPYIDKTRRHPAVAKARALYERALLLAPKAPHSYRQLSALFSYCDDVDGLRQLAARAQAADLDLADARRQRLDDFQGKNDGKYKADLRNGLEHQAKVVAAARSVRGATLAYALANLSRQKMMARMWGLDAQAAGMVEAAEEAHQVAPSRGTRSQLLAALLERAHGDLADKDAAYGALAKECRRSLYGISLIAVVLAEGEGAGAPASKACLVNTDVQRALAMVRDDSERSIETTTEWSWALLRQTHPDAAAKVAQFVLADERGRLNRVIQDRLTPLDALGAYQDSWRALIQGHPEQARQVLQKCAEAGVPLPMAK